jgi:hypothetical protein
VDSSEHDVSQNIGKEFPDTVQRSYVLECILKYHVFECILEY